MGGFDIQLRKASMIAYLPHEMSEQGLHVKNNRETSLFNPLFLGMHLNDLRHHYNLYKGTAFTHNRHTPATEARKTILIQGSLFLWCSK